MNILDDRTIELATKYGFNIKEIESIKANAMAHNRGPADAFVGEGTDTTDVMRRIQIMQRIGFSI